MTTPAVPFRVDTVTDSHGTYTERWMVPPPAEGVVFRVSADAWIREYVERPSGRLAPLTVRVIHEWEAVQPRPEP